MKNLSLKIFLVIAALFGSVGAATSEIIRYGDFPNQTCSFVIRGEINTQTLAIFRTDLNTLRNVNTCAKDSSGKLAQHFFKVVTLQDSVGGDLSAAFEIVKLITDYGLVTHVDDNLSFNTGCLSSCALIFAAGKERHYTKNKNSTSIDENVIFGIHKPYFLNGSYEYLKNERLLDEIKYKLINHFNESGVDPRFTIKVFETASENIVFPKITDMLIWRVITSLSLPETYKSAGLLNDHCPVKQPYEKFQYDVQSLKKHYYITKQKFRSKTVTEAKFEQVERAFFNVLSCLNYNFVD